MSECPVCNAVDDIRTPIHVCKNCRVNKTEEECWLLEKKTFGFNEKNVKQFTKQDMLDFAYDIVCYREFLGTTNLNWELCFEDWLEGKLEGKNEKK